MVQTPDPLAVETGETVAAAITTVVATAVAASVAVAVSQAVGMSSVTAVSAGGGGGAAVPLITQAQTLALLARVRISALSARLRSWVRVSHGSFARDRPRLAQP